MKPAIPVTRRRRDRQSGSSLVESTLCFLGFVFLTFGMMEACMAVYAYNFCSWAARDATRWASVRGSQSGYEVTNTEIQNYVRNEGIALTRNSVTTTTTWIPDNKPGSQVRVLVSYQVIPMVGLALRERFTVSRPSQTVISK